MSKLTKQWMSLLFTAVALSFALIAAVVTNFSYTPIFTVKDTESPDGFRRVVRIEQAMQAYEDNYVDKVSSSAYANMEKAMRRIYERVTGEKYPEETTPTETTVPTT